MPLLTIRLPRGSGLADALRKLRLVEEEVDGDYGLIEVDPDSGLFALRVSEAAAHRLAADTAATVFADPRIEPTEDPDSK
ncbi:hypothetical protein [Nocardia paucivorans]|uniref:hypothetical protein n=1 Tax=Nocardia paucivorans TaxID=114259 RepID=UPI0003018A34|nr:hypothetical protein [Nocardia paucivorans]